MTSSRPDFSPCTTDTTDTTAPANLVAGALAHLGTHMTTGCPRAAHLAAMLLEKVAADPEANPHLRGHACELAEILDHVQESGTRAPSQPEGSKKRRSAALRTEAVGHAAAFALGYHLYSHDAGTARGPLRSRIHHSRPRTSHSKTYTLTCLVLYWEWSNVRGLPRDLPSIDAYSAPGRALSVALTRDF